MLLMSLMLACTDKTPPVYTDDTGDTYVPWPDSDEQGTDDDGDGWTVEKGDCDDADIYVHPGWEESDREGNDQDGKDNDCDGRVDETFRGLEILQSGARDKNNAGGVTTAARIVRVNALGESEAEIVFDDASIQNGGYFNLQGTWIDFNFDLAPGVFDGWAVSGIERANFTNQLWEVSPTGETRSLVDWGELELGCYGVDTHPDGYYLAACVSSLMKVYPDGTVEEGASFVYEDPDGNPALTTLAFDVAVDHVTGEILVIGYEGGAVLIDPESWEQTFIVQITDPEQVEPNMWSAGFWDTRGGYYAGGRDSGGWAIFRLNEADGKWVKKVNILSSAATPHDLAIDTVYGEYFMSAYGGQNPMVWWVDADTEDQPTEFFRTSHSGEDWMDMWDLLVRY